MITVKELIGILEKLDPYALVVKPGHSDAGDSYDDIYLDDISRFITIREYGNRSWRGRYEQTQTLQPGGFWAYCV